VNAKSKLLKSVQPTVVQVFPNANALSFSLKEAAAITGVALWAIRSAVWGRKLPARFIGKRQIVLRADLEKWIASAPTVHGRKRAA
jgi:hypothetical protein